MPLMFYKLLLDLVGIFYEIDRDKVSLLKNIGSSSAIESGFFRTGKELRPFS